MNTKVDLNRYNDQIENEIQNSLKKHPSEPGNILFYGSSTMAHWRQNDMCYTQMAPLKITNTGFGGSTAEEALYNYYRLVKPFSPGVIAYYEGANDVKSGYSPQEILDMTHRVFEWARQDCPNVQFVIIPIKVCTHFENILDVCFECNNLFKEYAAEHDDTWYIDLDEFLYDADGNFRRDIYLEDMLHHNQAGYEELSTYVKPVVEQAFAKYQSLK